MIAKIIKSTSFHASVSYVMEKEKGELLSSKGVLNDSIKSIADSFDIQAQLRLRLKNKVGHISLSYSTNDAHRLTDKKMVQLAEEYMKAMKIENTQYIIVRHSDAKHPHCHIVYNKINDRGEVIPSKNDYSRSVRICKVLKDKYQLTYGTGKDKVNVHKLREPTKTKYEIYHAVKDALKISSDWEKFQRELSKQQIEVRFKYKGKSNEVQGLSFAKNSYAFKGSEIDKAFSYPKLDQKLGAYENELEHDCVRDYNEKTTNKQSNVIQQVGNVSSKLFAAFGSNDTSSEQEPSRKRRKR